MRKKKKEKKHGRGQPMSWVRALSGVGERLVKLWYKISFLFLLLSEVVIWPWWPILGICALSLIHPKCTHTHTHSSEHSSTSHTSRCHFRRTWFYQVRHVPGSTSLLTLNNIVINQSDLKNKFIIFVKFRLTISVCGLYISVIHLSFPLVLGITHG